MEKTPLMRKGARTKQRMLQAALYCLAHHGERETTFQKIADQCGVSQPLVVHYFKSRENIFRLVLEDFLTRARKKTEDSLNEKLSPPEKLRDYFRVSLALFRDEPEWARVYLMLFYFAGFHDEYRKINSDVKRVAVDRVANILKEGVAKGVFNVKQIELTAKMIHVTASGLIINILTENQSYPDQALLKTLDEIVLKYVAVTESKKR
jgi:AcrR family transcriptional regulator